MDFEHFLRRAIWYILLGFCACVVLGVMVLSLVLLGNFLPWLAGGIIVLGFLAFVGFLVEETWS